MEDERLERALARRLREVTGAAPVTERELRALVERGDAWRRTLGGLLAASERHARRPHGDSRSSLSAVAEELERAERLRRELAELELLLGELDARARRLRTDWLAHQARARRLGMRLARDGHTLQRGDPRPMPRPPQAYEELRKLQLVTEAALSALDLDQLLDELLIRTRDILDADTCAILLLDEATNELVARAAKGIEEEVEAGVRIPVGKGFAGRIAAARHPVVIPDVDHADVLNPILREKGIKSLLGAPLISRGRVLGVIHVGTLTPRDVHDDDVELLELAAERAAQGLERGARPRGARPRRGAAAQLRRARLARAADAGGRGVRRRGDAAPPARPLSAEHVDQLIDVLYLQSERLARLTEQLLDLSRLDAARVRIDTRADRRARPARGARAQPRRDARSMRSRSPSRAT